MGFRTYAQAGAQVSAGGGVPAATAGTSQWHPTVIYLGALIGAEMVLLGFVSHYLLKED